MRVSDGQRLPDLAGKPRGNRTFQPVLGSPDYSGVDAHIVLGSVDGARLSGVDIKAARPEDTRTAIAMPDSRNIVIDGTSQ